jgi:hypothetical protein
MKDFLLFIGISIFVAMFIIIAYIALDGIIMQERSLVNRFFKKK